MRIRSRRVVVAVMASAMLIGSASAALAVPRGAVSDAVFATRNGTRIGAVSDSVFGTGRGTRIGAVSDSVFGTRRPTRIGAVSDTVSGI